MSDQPRACKSASLRDYRNTCTNYYGCPKGSDGRPDDVAIQGIVIHYLGVSQDAYVDSMSSGPMPPTAGYHHSMHYTITPDGKILNHVNPDDLAWAHIACASNFPEPLAPPYSYPGWPVLSTANPGYPLDYYTLHIGITQEGTQGPSGRCDNDGCNGYQSALLPLGYSGLVRLIAELSVAYSIPIDSEHIQYHEFIEPVDMVEEVPCYDGCLVCDVADYCEGCVSEGDATYIETPLDDMANLYGETTEGCKGKLCLDDLVIPWDGDSPDGTINITNDGAGSPNKGHTPVLEVNISECDNQLLGAQTDGSGLCVQVFTDDTISGGGTSGDPFGVNLCALDVPSGTIEDNDYLGVDSAGCIVKSPLPPEPEFAATNGDGGISITAGGPFGHEPSINLNIASDADCPNNLMTVSAAGICVSETPFEGIPTDGSISITPGGINGHSPSIGVNIASGGDCPNNLISTTPSGLCAEVYVAGGITGSGTPGDPFVIDPCGGMNSIIPGGTPSTYVGFNAVGCLVQGLLPPPPPETVFAASNTDGVISITPGGPNGHNPVFESNIQTAGPVFGSGTSGDPIGLDRCGFAAIAPTQPIEFVLGLAPDECLVKEDADDFIRSRLSATDTSCIDMEYNQATGEFSASPIIAPTFPGLAGGCNGLVCTPNGLAVAPEKEFFCGSIPYQWWFSAPSTSFTEDQEDTAAIPPIFIQIDNDSPCYDLIASLHLFALVGLTAGDGSPEDQFSAEATFDYTIDNGGTWQPYSIIQTHATSHQQSDTGNNPAIDIAVTDNKIECVTIPPSSSITVGVRGGWRIQRAVAEGSLFIQQRVTFTGGHA